MGKHFGNIERVNRLVYFGVSPFEQKAFKGLFSKGIPNYLKNMVRNVCHAAPGICTAFYVIYWSRIESERLSRKQPGQYDNDT